MSVSTTERPIVVKKPIDTKVGAQLPLNPSAPVYSAVDKRIHNYKTAVGRESALIVELLELVHEMDQRLARLEGRTA